MKFIEVTPAHSISILDPEGLAIRSLAAAVIESAYSEAQPDRLKGDFEKRQRATLRREALAWIRRKDGEDEMFSFKWCCDACDLNADIIREKMLANLATGAMKSYRFRRGCR